MTILNSKRNAIVASAIVATLMVAALAAADPPTHQTVPISFSIVDHSLCGFAINETAAGEIDMTIFSNGLQIWHIHRFSTFSANGRTLTSNANFTRFIDPNEPQLVNDSGTIFNVQIPGEGAVFMQAGKLLLDQSTGQVISDAGPADFVNGDTAAFCAYLSP
jgi:hypothetical protein